MKKITLSIILLAMAAFSAQAAKPKTKPLAAKTDTIALTQREQEIRDSLNQIMDRAKANDPEAMNEVGTWYYTGKHVKQDYRQAADWWKKAALTRNVRAIGNLGLCYQYGHGVKRDSVDAVRLYKESIKNGNAKLLADRSASAEQSPFDAMLVGECYETGVGTKRDMAKAAEYYALAADKGSVEGMRMAGMCYLNSRKHPEKAFEYFRKGAAEAEPTCLYYTGKMLMGDMGVDENKQQGVLYLMQAAEANLPGAMNDVGVLYAEGTVVGQDVVQAARWYEKAALAGSGKGMWNYGNALKDGAGVEQNYDMALMWMAQAAPQGYQRAFGRMINDADTVADAFAAYVKGMKFYLIDGNLKEANEMFKRVEKANIPEGKIMQAVILADERNEKPNAKKAAQTLEKSASTDAESAYYLATLYENGTGVARDMAKAISLYRTAADKGYGKALNRLGDIFYEGIGTGRDVLMAVSLYEKALNALQLSAEGYTRLAECYEKGEGGLALDKKKAEELRKHKSTDPIPTLLKSLK